MKYILKDENGNVIAVSGIKFAENYELAEEDYDVGFDGKIYSVTAMKSTEYLTRKAEHDNEINLLILRNKREEECFPVINRGELWYAKLTAEQKEELSVWYQAWLDAPQTGIIPTKPEWLN